MAAEPRRTLTYPQVLTASTTFAGTLAGTDVWECVLWWWLGSGIGDLQTAATSLATAGDVRFRALWDSALGAMNTIDTTYLSTTARIYQPGHSAAAAEQRIGVTTKQGSGQQSGPASQACVMSLRTAQAGKSGRGRTYLPATASLGIDTEQHMFPSNRLTDLVTNFAGFLQAMNSEAISEPLPKAVVRSLAQGQVYEISSVRGDARPDSQEHRERNRIFTTVTTNVS